MKKIIVLFLASISIVSCGRKTSTIKVTNKVGSCRIENINFGKYRVPGSLITNETSRETEIRDKKNAFPKTYPLTFYMISQGNRVYLRTKEEFSMAGGAKLDITIDNNTPVAAP